MLLGVKEVKAKLGKIGINSVRQLMRDNQIKSFWINGKLLTTEDNINKYVSKMFNEKRNNDFAKAQ